MAILTSNDVFIYNGYAFPGGTATELVVRPVSSEDGRTIKYSIITISATWYVQSATSSEQESKVTDIIKSLQKQGGSYRYQLHGVGEITGYGEDRDVAWGPRPGDVKIRPLGPLAAMLRWELQIAYPQCDRGAGLLFTEYYYSISFSIDAAGYTSRRISGGIEIPQTRMDGNIRRVRKSVDEFYDQIVPAELPGFTRVSKERNVSNNRSKLTFNFVDEEQKDTPPANIVAAEGSFRIQSFPRVLSRYSATLSCSYTLAKRTPRQFAIDAFVKLMLDRTGAAKRIPGSAVVLIAFSAEEGLYDNAHRVSFSAQWTFASSLLNCVRDCGMFRPTGGSWDQWRNSPFNQSAMGVRGNAGLIVSAKDDAIIDLCANSFQEEGKPIVLTARRNSLADAVQALNGVSPNNSWISYDCAVQIATNENTTLLKPIPKEPLSGLRNAVNRVLSGFPGGGGAGGPSSPGGGAGGTGTGTGGGTGGGSGQQQPGPLPPDNTRGTLITGGGAQPTKDQVQQRATTTYTVTLVGSAVRAGFEISPPQLVSIGGAEVKQLSQDFQQQRVAQYSDQVYKARWKIVYRTVSPPTKQQIVTPGNPSYQVRGI